VSARRVIEARELANGMRILFPRESFRVADIAPAHGMVVEVLLEWPNGNYDWWDFHAHETLAVEGP
jgi:hypothetical protein